MKMEYVLANLERSNFKNFPGPPVGPNQGGASLDTIFQKISRTPAGGLRAPRPCRRIGTPISTPIRHRVHRNSKRESFVSSLTFSEHSC